MNIGDMSMDSLADVPSTPLPSRLKSDARPPSMMFTKTKPSEPVLHRILSPPEAITLDHGGARATSSDEPGNEPDEQDEDEKTVVLKKAPPLTPSPPRPSTSVELPAQTTPSPARKEPPREDERVRPVTPVRPQSVSGIATPGTERKSRLQITSDTERIVVSSPLILCELLFIFAAQTRIWSTMGDIIMPGHPFDVATAATSNKPPRAKETMFVLPPLIFFAYSFTSITAHSSKHSPRNLLLPHPPPPTRPQRSHSQTSPVLMRAPHKLKQPRRKC